MKKHTVIFKNLKTGYEWKKIYNLEDSIDLENFLKREIEFLKALSDHDHAVIY